MKARRDKAKQLRINERKFVEEPLLEQLDGLGWEILDLDGSKQKPEESNRTDFAQVTMESVLREQLNMINDWLEDDQVDEVVHRIITMPSTNLLENNKYVQRLLWEGTSVAENRKSGERSPTVRYIDYGTRDSNRFIAVCQLKVRIPGTDKHIKPDIVLFLNGLPIAVIECKSPKVEEPIAEAIDQMMRYSVQRGYENEGVPATAVPQLDSHKANLIWGSLFSLGGGSGSISSEMDLRSKIPTCSTRNSRCTDQLVLLMYFRYATSR